MGEGKILPCSLQQETQFVRTPYGHTAIINAKNASQNCKWQYNVHLFNSEETEKGLGDRRDKGKEGRIKE